VSNTLRSASKDVEEGRFHPERVNDELTRALGNDEHLGRTRTTPGSKPWKLGFPVKRKKFPDRSRQRRKEREADRMSLIEEELKRQSDLLNRMRRLGTATSQPQIEAAHDATDPPSQRKSSVASTDLPEDDGEPAIRYPVDDIAKSTSCEQHVKIMNITMEVAVGYALPIGPNATYHCHLIPHGYAIAGVDKVMGGFEQLKLDHPVGEGDLYELGEAKKTTVLWLKEYIVLPNWTPRSPVCHPSPPPRQPSPPSLHQPSPASLPRQPSPAYQPSPASEPSAPPLPTEAQSQKRKRTIAAPSMSHRNRSPIRRQEPLPRVPKVPPKRPYDRTPEANAAIIQEKSETFFENLKKKRTEKSAEQPPLDPKVLKILKTLHQPEPRLASDYDRNILKSDATKWSKGKSVPRLSEQMNSCPPLQVFHNVQYDLEIIALYKEEAEAHGMSVS
jgi:hypothetical protein